MYDLMIVGGGPAGLTASVYAARKQLKTLLISFDIGGQVNNTWGVENYMGYQFIEGPELMDKFQEQVKQFPIDQKIGNKVSRLEKLNDGFEAISEAGDKYQATVAIYAAGKSPRKLGVPGETEFTGKGVTYCAICDGPVFSGQRVAVVGGGNSALEAALDMVKIAEHVDLVSLTPLTGDAILVDKLSAAKNLTIYTEYQTEKIEGQDFARGILIKELLELYKRGEVPINCSCDTAILGLYAAGDVTDVPEKQIVVAAGEGAKAALQAHRYLQRLNT